MINFRSKDFISSHIKGILDFYLNNAIDPKGGFFQTLLPSGEQQNKTQKHLVSSARLTMVFALAHKEWPEQRYLDALKHGLSFIEEKHYDAATKTYNWTLDGDAVTDTKNYCYGHAFIVLMYATLHKAGFAGAKEKLEESYQIMEDQLWEEQYGLYADEASADWSVVDPYRGQNANMHSCEAMIAAYEATQEQRYLDRAMTIAKNICIRQTEDSNGLVWEHYDQDWKIDWDFNKDDPKNLYRPWGYQPGHLTEWTKLLLIINRYQPEAWLLERAETLFQVAMDKAWDQKNGGLFYGFGPDGSICDDEKYFWVHAETLGAAALLAQSSGKEQYWQDYDRIWTYSWTAFCEEKHQPWWRLLDAQNKVIDPTIASPGAKIDYHTVAAFIEVLHTLP